LLRLAQGAFWRFQAVDDAMGFGDAIRTCFSKYATFSGRASRSEYWFFMLFSVIAPFAGSLIDNAAGADIVASLIELVLFLPGLAVFVRRLHDIDRTGWWVLLPLVPVIGGLMMLGLYAAGVAGGSWFWPLIHWIVLCGMVSGIVLLVWSCKRGTPDPNRYGPDPLAGEARAQA
jgi:uncharacterized membrane protein YhaH (DUF805 family)